MTSISNQILLSALTLLAIGVSPAAAVTLADLRADYDTPTTAHTEGESSLGKIPDSSGTGAWNFYSSTTATLTNPGTALTLLTYTETSDSVRAENAYVSSGALFDLPAWKNANLITPVETEGDPASNELAVHPGDSGIYAVAAWTSGYAGLVNISGSLTDLGVFGDGVILDIWFNESLFSSEATSSNLPITFSETITVGVSDVVYFVVGSNSNFGSDQAALSVTITVIPEPSSYAAFFGVGALTYCLFRRRRAG